MRRRTIPWVLLAIATLAAAPGSTGASAPVGDARDTAASPQIGLPVPWTMQTPAETDDPVDPPYVENELIVKFKPGVSPEVRRQLHAVYGAQVIADHASHDIQLLRLPDDVVYMAGAYQSRDEIVFAEPNYLAHVQGWPGGPEVVENPQAPGGKDGAPDAPQAVPNDTLYAQQWHLAKIDAPRAWDYSLGAGIVVAVIDTGTFCQHTDLAGKCLAGRDFVNNDGFPDDDHGHGTHVAGIAAAMTNNARGVAGVGWDASIMPLKALNAAGNGGHFQIGSAIDYAVDNGADVINLSLGSFFTSGTLSSAVGRAINAGVVVVAAAGNASSSNPTYPAAYAGVIGVAATTQSDGRASFSNYGDYVDVAAPGVGIFSTVASGGYQSFNGTSMASPVVAGAAALLVAQDPSRQGDDVQAILEATAVDLGTQGRDHQFGAGRIDIGAALAYGAGNVPTPPGPPTATPTYGPQPATATPASDLVQQLEDLINHERTRIGLPPLASSAALRSAATRHSNDMGRGGFCSHNGSDGSTAYTRMRDAGYARPYGEIVTCGQTSPAAAVGAWMSSSGHRAIIYCTTCTELGGGHGTGSFGYWNYWTVNFGSNPYGGPSPTPLSTPTPAATRTIGPPTSSPTPSPTPPGVPPGGTEVILQPPNNRVGWVVSTLPDENFFDDDDTFTGVYLDTRIYHGAMQFDLGVIPAGAFINYARLELTGRSADLLGSSGTWAVRLLEESVDADFEDHGYATIHNATADATLLPLMGTGDLAVNRKNVFTLTPSQVGLVASRVAGARMLSFRIDGPTGGSNSNLFTWDTGYGPDSRYPGPKLIVHYSMTAPTAAPTSTATDIPGPTETPPAPTEGPSPTPTNTPIPDTPTATAPPKPEHTATPTGIPTIQPHPSAIEIVPSSGDVGWVKQGELGNHFGDADTFTGYYQGYVYHGAVQFDLSAIPPDSSIASARITLTGRDNRYVSPYGNGRWQVAILEPAADVGWRNHSFNSIRRASTQSLMRPDMIQADLDVGRSNTFLFNDDQLWFLRDRVSTTRKLSLRFEGPRAGVSNVFSWATGYGGGEPPRLTIVLGPPSGGDNPAPTPDPLHVERLARLVQRINAEREKAGVTPLTGSTQLEAAAHGHTVDMAMHDFFSHTGSDGSTPEQRVARSGFEATIADEVLAAAHSDPDVIVDAWMARDQRAVILDPRFTHVGAAYMFRTLTAYRHYWTVKLALVAP